MAHGQAGGIDRRTVAKSAVAAAALLLAGGGGGGIAQARTADGITLRLPAPTGPHRIGVTTLYLVDRSRRDPWDERIPVREVMATVFYPARTAVGDRPAAPQMTAGAAEVFRQIDVLIHHLPPTGVNWAATRTHAQPGAPAQPVRRPVLLYSPGGGDPRTLGTSVAEELASHGHVVVTVDHPGDASEVEFPGRTPYRRKRIRETVFRGDPRTDPQLFRTAIGTRIADIRFVLDRLESLAAGRNPDALGRALPTDLGRALDLRRTGVYGHSAGGTAVAEAMYEDRRLGAAVNLEGYLDQPPRHPGEPGDLFPVARHGTDRPLLLLGTEGFAHRRELDPSWSAALTHSRGRARRAQLDGAAHWVFTDYAAMAPQLQTAGLMTAGARRDLVGALDPSVSVPAVRDAVRLFFARHLRA
ncbi:alpha/beta hydrolase [Streptomyces morookaense]|uniref:Alpha/beta hydrolase n=1 Tax=Streptomyces morookaense TaxID=1970 RepID=A0A7Y7BB94_STRMO|nr:alpha/beta hydrolase [Streptomyces morookaense]NVK82330.1 alpha/beta hydrolase [Streptomyces morookaense]GHF47192.1 lipase [Streptomyces morookaense]